MQEEYAYLLIITKGTPNILTNVDYLLLHDNFTFLDDCHIKVNNKVIEFCYLIYSNLINVTYPTTSFIISENDIPLTNWIYQTSIENIYYINEVNLNEVVNEIISCE